MMTKKNKDSVISFSSAKKQAAKSAACFFIARM